MNFTQAIRTVYVDKYCCFRGRASRSEYWYNFLFQYILYILLSVIIQFVGFSSSNLSIIFNLLLCLVFTIPSWAVSCRRLHDLGRSGWWLLSGILIFPLLIFLIYFCFKGTTGSNTYGQDPLTGIKTRATSSPSSTIRARIGDNPPFTLRDGDIIGRACKGSEYLSPFPRVSSRHVSVHFKDGLWKIMDLSSGGTWNPNQKLDSGVPYPIQNQMPYMLAQACPVRFEIPWL